METRVKEGRTALAITVLLIATLTVPSLIAGGAFSLAQAQQSPSPTGTAPTIELVNPSDYEGTPVLSDKDNNPGNDASGDDPNDEKYHFNAWTRNAPNNATVEFFIVQGSNQVSLGLAQSQGNGVYDLYSGIPDQLTDTSADVRAVLYAGGELDRDEQPVLINDETESSDTEAVLMQGEYRATNEAETAEITYPLNGGGLGFFGRPDQAPAANIEVRHSRTGTAGSAGNQGGGPENLRAYYTTSHRGTDPDWKVCGTESQTDSAEGVRCQLTNGDRPEWVTGVAVVTRDSESSETSPRNVGAMEVRNAGDAHVVAGYSQTPSSVTIGSPTGSTPTGCSPLIPVTVADQIGQKIVGAPVDVHAQGPTDSLAFNTEDDEHDPDNDNNPDPDPNDQPENHATEQGRQCSDQALAEENQGEHEEAGALPDRKHIESTDGTDGNGQFIYQMWSNSPGGTTMTAFVDMDEDDLFCATEAFGNGIITWGSGGPNAPLPSGPDVQSCPASQSGSSSSGTASRTSASSASSTTTSPTNTATQTTTSPTNTASQTTTSPTNTGTTTSPTNSGTGTTTSGTAGTTQTSPQRSEVEVTLETSQPRKTFGKSFTLSGSVSSDNEACTDLVNVQVLRDVLGGEEDFELFAQETTDANGAYTVSDKADRSANYIAQVNETATCDDATSAPQPVLVRTKVSLILSKTKVREGGRVRFTIKTAPCPATARDRVLLFRAVDGEFGKAAGKRTNGRCAAKIVRRINETSVFQARWPKQTPELLAGRSRSKVVKVTR
ncbi:MAG TPA: hypothetical protein VEU29_05295 [Actinomycetota bacterium]|nr:hypothetical protein [Actinomycetota bacterium]